MLLDGNLGHNRMKKIKDGKISVLGQETIFIHNSGGTFFSTKKLGFMTKYRTTVEYYRNLYAQAQLLADSY